MSSSTVSPLLSTEYFQYLLQFIDVSLISNTSSEFEKSLFEGKLKNVFEGIDQNVEIELLTNMILKQLVMLSDAIAENLAEVETQLDSITSTLINNNPIREKALFNAFYALLKLFLKENWTGPSFNSADINKKMKREKQAKSQLIRQKAYPKYDFSSLKQSKLAFNLLGQSSKNVSGFTSDATTLDDLNTFNYKFIKTTYFLNTPSSKALQEHLEVDGETFPTRLPLSHVFFVIIKLIANLQAFSPSNPVYNLFAARVHLLHSQLLYLPTGSLYPKVIQSYSSFFKNLKDHGLKLPRSVLSNLYAENSHALLFFYKYSDSQRALALSQELLRIEFSLTGKMGKRTKYQTFNTCQLVVQVFDKKENDETKKEENQQEDEDEEEKDSNDNKQKFTGSLSAEDKAIIAEENSDKIDVNSVINEMKLTFAPQNIRLDEECVLLEKPLIDETDEFNQTVINQKDEKSQLSLNEQILVLALMKHHEIANPHDDIYHEYIQAYCNLLIDKSLNWMVFSTSLLYRSLNEYIRYKKMERALLQMQTLVDQYNDPLPDENERSKYLFCLNYPHYFELQKTLGEKYMKVGIVMSGCQIFERLGMFEECVECLQAAGHSDKAIKMAQIYLPTASPKLLCIYGELTREMKYYKQAWKLSNKKFARAQRSLGKVYFYAGQLEKAVKAFKKAVAINRYTVAPWFTMGCAYIKLNDLNNAVRCFGTVVSINESDGESWANLSSCFMKLGKKTEALSTLEQASKFCERNWRIWENLMYVSLSSQKFYKYFECIEKLLSLNQKSSIDEESVGKLVQIFKFQLSKYHSTEFKHQFLTYRNRIEKMFNLLNLEMGEKFFVWKSWADFKEVEIDFQEMQTDFLIQKHQEWDKNVESANKRISYVGEDPNATPAQLKAAFVATKRELLNRIADLRMNTCQVLQIVGWQVEKKQCELVLSNAVLLIKAYKEGKSGNDLKELDMFVKQIKSVVEQSLEREVKLEI